MRDDSTFFKAKDHSVTYEWTKKKKTEVTQKKVAFDIRLNQPYGNKYLNH